jgi:hypothetical protein
MRVEIYGDGARVGPCVVVLGMTFSSGEDGVEFCRDVGEGIGAMEEWD